MQIRTHYMMSEKRNENEGEFHAYFSNMNGKLVDNNKVWKLGETSQIKRVANYQSLHRGNFKSKVFLGAVIEIQ